MYFNRKDGDDIMKVLAGHHISPETLLPIVILAGLLLGVVIGFLVGTTLNNIGAGISLGVLIGLICGITGGVFLSGRAE